MGRFLVVLGRVVLDRKLSATIICVRTSSRLLRTTLRFFKYLFIRVVAAKEFESDARTVTPPCASGFESSSASHRNTGLTVAIPLIHGCCSTLFFPFWEKIDFVQDIQVSCIVCVYHHYRPPDNALFLRQVLVRIRSYFPACYSMLPYIVHLGNNQLRKTTILLNTSCRARNSLFAFCFCLSFCLLPSPFLFLSEFLKTRVLLDNSTVQYLNKSGETKSRTLRYDKNE